MSVVEPEGHWVGKEKKRYDFVLKYLSGNSTSRGNCVHNFKDRNGARFIAFIDASEILIEEEDSGGEFQEHAIKTGDCFTCKATVNRHGINTYKHGSKGTYKETVFNRIKFYKYIGKEKIPL